MPRHRVHGSRVRQSARHCPSAVKGQRRHESGWYAASCLLQSPARACTVQAPVDCLGAHCRLVRIGRRSATPLTCAGDQAVASFAAATRAQFGLGGEPARLRALSPAPRYSVHGRRADSERELAVVRHLATDRRRLTGSASVRWPKATASRAAARPRAARDFLSVGHRGGPPPCRPTQPAPCNTAVIAAAIPRAFVGPQISCSSSHDHRCSYPRTLPPLPPSCSQTAVAFT